MRFSPGLVQTHIFSDQVDEGVLTALLHTLADRQINLSFLSIDCTQGVNANLCMAKDDFAKAQKVMSKLLLPMQIEASHYNSVGTLALFPHQSRLKLAALTLAIFAENQLPVYGMSSSISALSLNTDYSSLDKAADLLKTVFQLPENHTPFRQHLSESIAGKEKGTCQKRPFVETAASYWEPVIKIYGSSIKTDLELASLRISDTEMATLSTQLCCSEDNHGFFELIVAHPIKQGALQLVVLYEKDRRKSVYKLLAGLIRNIDACLVENPPVELLYFHGPHFQDRFGVADAVFGSLQKHQIKILAAGCTGTSIYLVTHKDMAHVAAGILTDIFYTPNLIA